MTLCSAHVSSQVSGFDRCSQVGDQQERVTGLQRLGPLGTRPRTHVDRHQAVVRPGGGGQREGRLYEVQRAQATRAALSAAPLTAPRRRQLAVSTCNGSLTGEIRRLEADVRKFSRGCSTAVYGRHMNVSGDDPRRHKAPGADDHRSLGELTVQSMFSERAPFAAADQRTRPALRCLRPGR